MTSSATQPTDDDHPLRSDQPIDHSDHDSSQPHEHPLDHADDPSTDPRLPSLPYLPPQSELTDGDRQHDPSSFGSSHPLSFSHHPQADDSHDDGSSTVNGLAPHIAAELDAALLLHHQAGPSDYHHLDHDPSAYDPNHDSHADEMHHPGGALDGYGEGDTHEVEHVSGLTEAIHAFHPHDNYGDYDEAANTNAVASGSGTQVKPPRKKRVKVAAERSEPGEPGEKKKREQVKNACTNCQKSRKKCTGERPCPNCVKSGSEDSCVDSNRRPRPKGIKRGPYKKKNRVADDGTILASYEIYQHQTFQQNEGDPSAASEGISSSPAFPLDPTDQSQHPLELSQHPSDPLDHQAQTDHVDAAYYDEHHSAGSDGRNGLETGPPSVGKRRRGEKKSGGGAADGGRLSEAMIVDEDASAEDSHLGEEERAYQLGQRELGVLDHRLFTHDAPHHDPHREQDGHAETDSDMFARQLAQINGEDRELGRAKDELEGEGREVEEEAHRYEVERQLSDV